VSSPRSQLLAETLGICMLASTLGLTTLASVIPATAQANPTSGDVIAVESRLPRPSSSGAIEVVLLTGDRVKLDRAGRVAGVVPGLRPDGSVPRFSVFTVRSQTYVIPSDVRRLIGQSLDRELFNVTRLVADGLGGGAPLPVVVVPANPDAQAAAGTVDASVWGVQLDRSLGAIPAQAGVVDVTAESGPAPGWALLKALSVPPVSARDGETDAPAVDSVWLDRRQKVDSRATTAAGAEPGSGAPAWLSLIGADRARADGWSGHGVTVGVVDSGVDANHPDLIDQVVAAQDFTGDDAAGDGSGHGTFVASEIAGTGAASDGRYVGVAPGASIVDARVLDAAGEGFDSNIMAGLGWAAQQGARVINVSLGNRGDYDDGTSFFDRFVDRVAQQYDCLIVVAAGNDGTPQSVSAPATADDVLSVGATLQDGSLAWFSSTGPRRGDGAVNPQIMAPGAGEILLDADGNELPGGVGPSTTGLVGAGAGTTGYVSDGWFGTSMAAPLVAGAAALLAEADPTADHADLRAKLMAAARPLPGDSSPFDQGAGLLDIPAALAQTVTASPTQLNLGAIAAPHPTNVEQTLTLVNHGPTAESLTLGAELTFAESLAAPPPPWTPPPPDLAGALGGQTGAHVTAGSDAGVTPATDTDVTAAADTDVTAAADTDVTAATDMDVSPAADAGATPSAVTGVTAATDAAVGAAGADGVTLSNDTVTIPDGGTATVTVGVDPSRFSAGYIGLPLHNSQDSSPHPRAQQRRRHHADPVVAPAIGRAARGEDDGVEEIVAQLILEPAQVLDLLFSASHQANALVLVGTCRRDGPRPRAAWPAPSLGRSSRRAGDGVDAPASPAVSAPATTTQLVGDSVAVACPHRGWRNPRGCAPTRVGRDTSALWAPGPRLPAPHSPLQPSGPPASPETVTRCSMRTWTPDDGRFSG